MKTIKAGILLATCAIICISTLAFSRQAPFPEPPAYSPHPAGEFPLVAGYAFYQPYITSQQVQWVKEAGFNTIIQNLSEKDLDSILTLADRFDIYVMASPYGKTDPSYLPTIIKKYADNPRVWGFGLKDEPNVSEFPQLAELQEIMHNLAPEQNAFFNLFSDAGEEWLGVPDFRTYVEQYVRIVNPPYISYDHYPVRIRKNGQIYVDDKFFGSLEVIRDVALKSGRPFWGYILTNKHWFYPKPFEAGIRFQVFSNLAYGAQGLSYYTYTLPDFDIRKDVAEREYSDAPIDLDGNRTDVWYMVRNVNSEIRNLEKVFLGAEVTDVGFTGKKIPSGASRIGRLPEPFGIIESGGEGVLVSVLQNGAEKYLMLVNRDVNRSQQVRLPRSRSVWRMFPDGTRRIDNGPYLTLDPGGYAIFNY